VLRLNTTDLRDFDGIKINKNSKNPHPDGTFYVIDQEVFNGMTVEENPAHDEGWVMSRIAFDD